MDSPPFCPFCHSSFSVRPLIYGKPSADLVAYAARGKAVLAGCLLTDGAPSWTCLQCSARY